MNNKIILISAFLILSVCIALVASNVYRINNDTKILKESLLGGEWVCIAQTCTDWATGDDWITDNCRPLTDDNNVISLICDVVIGDDTYTAPLNILNSSNLRSCRKYSCVTEVFVKGIMEVE